MRSVEASLKRLNTDYVDVLFMHHFDSRTDLDETLRAFEDLVRSGKILYPAVSNFSAWQAIKTLERQHACGFGPIVAAQPMYNLVKRQAEVEILPMAQHENLAVLPYSPLGGGLLTGKYAKKAAAKGRILENKIYEARYAGQDNSRLRGKRSAPSRKKVGVEPLVLAIAWVKSHPAVTAPLIGARNEKTTRDLPQGTRL